MQLDAFSISLVVKDIYASRAFYEKLGFSVFGGNIDQNWLILKNEATVIGLLQGMFEKNMLTFNPGRDSGANNLAEYADVRAIQQQLKAQGIRFKSEADATTAGPASFMCWTRTGTRLINTAKLPPNLSDAAEPLNR